MLLFKRNPKCKEVMNATECTKFLSDFLFTKGQVGEALYKRYLAFWNPSARVDLLEKVSRHTYANDSTLNITDSIQTIFRSQFFRFSCVHVQKVERGR